MKRFRDLSIRVKLTLLLTAASSIVLVLVSGVILAYEWSRFRSDLVRETESLADVVGKNGGSAILFGDAGVAGEILSALFTRDHVVTAAFYDRSGELLAIHRRSGEVTARLDRAADPGSVFHDNHLLLTRPVFLDGEQVGSVLIESDTGELTDRLKGYTLLLGGVLLLAVLSAGVLALWLQGFLTRPVLGLVEAADAIARDRDYEVRVESDATDEVGKLIRSFNGMLDQIQIRDRHLEEAQTELRARVRDLQREIGERKEAQETLQHREAELRQAQRMETVGVLAGGVAHDFNNILTAILGYCQLLTMRLPADSREAGTVAEIFKAGERAAALTRQLLAFSRKQVLEPRVVDLNETATGMEKMLRRVIGETITLKSELEPDLGLVRADPSQLEQILMNLAVNARDAMPDGGTLVLGTRSLAAEDAARHPELAPGDHVMVFTRDTGCGMNPAVAERVFEPFFTTKDEGKGTGLGLSTVYGIVKQSEGHVELESRPGEGTEFRIYLPRCAEARAAHGEASGEQASTRGTERILLVEDQVEVRVATREILRAFGYQVIEAEHGAAALGLCRDAGESIDLLLSDVVMPGINGRELGERARELVPGLLVLLMSGYTEDAIIRAGVRDANLPFIQKPFLAVDLTAQIRSLLDEGRREAA